MAETKKNIKSNVEVKKNVEKRAFESKVALPNSVFNLDGDYSQAIFDTIIAERASRRQGTHKVKNRAEVSGTGKKPWRQKGTGRARTGSMRGPIWVGGGRAFGPTVERNYNLKVNKKVRSLAFFSSLTELAKNKQVLVEEIKMDEISTKGLISKLTELNANDLRNILVVTNDEKLFLSARNLKNVTVTKVTSILVEELVRTDLMIIGSEDIKYLEGLVK